MCLRKMFASYPRSAYLGYSFHHRGCSVAVFLDGLLVKSILFVSLCAVNVLDVKNICMFAEWCLLQTFNDIVHLTLPASHLSTSSLPPPRPRSRCLLHAHHKNPNLNNAHPRTGRVHYGSLSYNCASLAGGVIGTTTKKMLLKPKKMASIRRPAVGYGIGEEESREESDRRER